MAARLHPRHPKPTLNRVWALLAATLFHLPDVSGLPQVAAVSARALTIVNTGFVVIIMVVGVVVMTRDTVQARYGTAELVPRLVIGLVAANFATPICRAITTTANALVEALGSLAQERLRPGQGRLGPGRRRPCADADDRQRRRRIRIPRPGPWADKFATDLTTVLTLPIPN